MNRREVLATSGSIALSSIIATPGVAAGGRDPSPLLRHRFGLNYVPSRNWYYCWNDWDASSIARDFDAVHAIGADHLRVQIVFPWFQPNPRAISQAHLARLDETMRLAGERNLDVMPTVFTGWLSGFAFRPTYYTDKPFFEAPEWQAVQEHFITDLARVLMPHKNFMGFDIANEINGSWRTTPDIGDPWMARIFALMRRVAPDRLHINGMDAQPWFKPDNFSPQQLVAQHSIVPLHAYPFWTGAGKHGGHLDKPYTDIASGMAALARSFGNDPTKPIWLGEFGACSAEMPEADVPVWMEKAVRSGIRQGISWFSWWGSHDVDRRFEFNDFEYNLGLITIDNKIKEQGLMFKRLADAYRGKPVVIPKGSLPPPPTVRTDDATWQWLLAWMKTSS